MEHFKSKIVTYFYDEEIGNFCYGGGNPMRPHRVRLTHNLVDNYGLIDKLKVFRPTPQDQDEIAMFHADGELSVICHLDNGVSGDLCCPPPPPARPHTHTHTE